MILQKKRGFQVLGLTLAITALAYGHYGYPQVALAATGVTGTVQNPSGSPVTGTAVTVCFYGQSGGGCADTDPSNGTYTLTLNAGHYRSETRPPASLNFGPALDQEIDVFDGQTTGNIVLRLATVQMKGKLQKTDGTAVQGYVNVHNSDWSKKANASSDQDGNYTVGGLEAGVYSVDVGNYPSVTGVSAPDSVEVTLGTDVVTKDFVFSAATKTLTGTVKKSDGTVVSGACINANKLGASGFGNGNADSAGKFTMTLNGGSWNINVNSCQGPADWIYAGAPLLVDFAQDASVEIKTLDINVTSASAKVAGTLKDQTGAAITQGGIDIRNASGVGAYAQIGAGGAFSANLSAGTYEVHFWQPGYSLQDPGPVTVADGQTVTLALVAKAKTAHIKGCVKTTDGAAAPNVMINAFEMKGPGGGPGNFGNARSGQDCTFDILVSAGTYGVNIGTEPGSAFIAVQSGPSPQVSVATDTTTVTLDTLLVQKADAAITGKLLADGKPLSNVQGCIYARAAGTSNQNGCSPLDPRTGTFTLKVSTSGGTAFEIGCNMPPNSGFSCGSPTAVTATPNGSVTKDINLTANNSSISGSVFDSSGFKFSNCSTMKGSMVFADGSGQHYQGEIKSDCTYSISLVAGVYNIGTFFSSESGCLNRPPEKPTQVFNSQTVQKNLQCTKADASIVVSLLNIDGTGTQGFVMVDNSQEINNSREGSGPGSAGGQGGQGGPNGPKDQNKGADLGFNKPLPCGAKPDDFNAVMKCCSDKKNKSTCTAFEVPQGPNGCKNMWDCVQMCSKNPSSCKDEKQGNQNQGPQPGQGDFKTGPGGCASPEACQKYCSEPGHQTECSQFKPPSSAQSIKISSVGRAVKAKATATTPSADKGGASFDKAIRSGGSTDFQGKAKIQVLSGHKYKVCAGLPPEAKAMPPKCQDVDLTSAKSANVVLQLRVADATMSGSVTLNGKATSPCYVHAWGEDGSFSGQQCDGSGKYTISLTKDTTWHLGADSFNDTKFYRSDEVVKVVTGSTKTFSQNLVLQEQEFEIPHPVTSSGTCSDTITLGLTNGASLSIPGGAISTSETGSCSVTASPTIELVATQSNQPEGVGYTIEARDENGAVVSKLSSSATFTLPYKLSKDQEGTDFETGLKAVFYDSTLGAYKNLDNCTQDTSSDQFQCRVDHFSAYAVSNASGSSSKSASLKSVTTSTAKKTGYGTFKVGSKTVTPFKCKGSLSVATKSVKGAQLIAAGSTCSSSVAVFDTKGKQKKSQNIGSTVNALTFTDVTGDGLADVIAAPSSGTTIYIIRMGEKKTPVSAVTASSRKAKLTATAIDFSGNGIASLVTGTVVNGKATGLQVQKATKGKFKATSSRYSPYLSGSNGIISLSISKAKVTSVSKKSVGKSTKNAAVTLKGTGFTPNSTVLVGTVGAKVSYKSPTQITITVDATKLGTGNYSITVTNPGGKTSSDKKLKVS